MKNILILCTGNSCRSQIAEGYLKYFAANTAHVYSAGVEVHGVNSKAVEIMAEDGIDISGHTSNHVEEYANIPFDFVITVCDHALERCPFFPTQAMRFHQNFPDPAKATGSTDEVLQSFRTTRNMVKAYCAKFVEEHLVSSNS